MRFSSFLSSAVALGTCALAQSETTGLLGDAIPVTNNPPGVVAIAVLPEDAFTPEGLDGNVRGWVQVTTGPDGVGANFEVLFYNLPPDGGPFIYHIHVDPVVDGNCTNTQAHLDPFIRGESPPCDATRPETCQVGDLSGKHGAVTSDPFIASYHDPFLSVVEGPGSYFLNRSMVFHYANTTRITCSNFKIIGQGGDANTK
ncbi:superoxide dismutase [Xylaria intraflava]|nr:superoxide dismutase [Xylaria intraflava]